MLKIKDEKWQEFRERASEIGFVFFNKGFLSESYQSINLIVFTNDKNIYQKLNANGLTELYDLITQGFVEKCDGNE